MGRIILPLYTPRYVPNGGEVAVIQTSRGAIRARLAGKDAPVTVGNFIELAARGFYDGLKFHACKPGSIVVGGCPTTRTLGPAQVEAAAGCVGEQHPGEDIEQFVSHVDEQDRQGSMRVEEQRDGHEPRHHDGQ